MHVLLDDPDRHRGVPDLDLGAVVHAGVGDAVAVDLHAVGRAEVAHLDPDLVGAGPGGHHELDVPAAHPGVVDPHVRLGAATDHEPGRDQRVPGAVDLQHRAGAAYLGVRGAAGHLGLRAAADPEPAGGEVLGGLEVDLDRPGERVALLLGVLLGLVGELLGQRGV